MLEAENISLLKERLDHFQTRLSEAENRAKSAEKDTIELKARLDRRETQVISLGSAVVLSAALFGLISWASFGSWVSTALKGTVAGTTLASLEAAKQSSDQLIEQMKAQVDAPITLLGKASVCQENKFNPPYGSRNNFSLLVVPEVMDAAFPKDRINQDNVIQMFESHVENDPTGTGWIVYANVRILWGLTDASRVEKSHDCQSGQLEGNRTTVLVYAIAN